MQAIDLKNQAKKNLKNDNYVLKLSSLTKEEREVLLNKYKYSLVKVKSKGDSFEDINYQQKIISVLPDKLIKWLKLNNLKLANVQIYFDNKFFKYDAYVSGEAQITDQQLLKAAKSTARFNLKRKEDIKSAKAKELARQKAKENTTALIIQDKESAIAAINNLKSKYGV